MPPVTSQGIRLEPVWVRLDAIKMTLDEGENYLFFINKKDNFLWKLDLK
jgi:hypothetical protein